MEISWKSLPYDRLKKWGVDRLSRWFPFQKISALQRTWEIAPKVLQTVLIATLLTNVLSLAFPITLLQVYDRVIPNMATQTLVLLTFGVGIAIILETILRVLRAYVSAWADAKFEHMTGCEAFNRLTESSLENYHQQGTGAHLERLSALSNLRDFYAGQTLIALVDVPFVAVFLLLIAYIGGWLVLIPILMLVYFLHTSLNYGNQLNHLLKTRNQQDDSKLNFIIEVFNGIHTIKGVAMEAQMVRRYERLQNSHQKNSKQIISTNSSNYTMGLCITQLTMVLVVAVGSRFVINGDLTIGGLAACTLLSMRCAQPINRAVSIWSRLQNVKLAQEKLQTVLDLPSEIKGNLPTIPKLQGNIALVDIKFRYDDQSPWLFNHLNLTINAGEMIVIKSNGASGKTALLSLIMGLYKPTEGKILLDGHDISQFNIRSARKQMAFLPTQGKLFNGTIMENLTKFQEENYFEQAKATAKSLGLTEIIQSFPDGYDTILGGQVVETLSRGIKQRIIIARELINNPPIILFDEANTAIDIKGDDTLKRWLLSAKGHCTIVMISHRPSLVKMADKTYSLEKGQVTQV